MSDHIAVTSEVDHVMALCTFPIGICVVRRHYDAGETWLTVLRSDPHVEFTDELLTNISNGYEPNINDGTVYPDVRLVQPADYPLDSPWVRHHDHGFYIEDKCDIPERCFTNWMLHIDARDQHLIYRIGDYVPGRDAWCASWPD